MNESMIVAAIDFGSNAARLVIARYQPNQTLEILKSVREPVRLGADVFANTGHGTISEDLIRQTLHVFESFANLLEEFKVSHYRAVGTSALREATNGEHVISCIQNATHLQLEIIGGDEEARLIFLAAEHLLKIRNKSALLIDIGGGSIEISFTKEGKLLSVDSYPLGAVRLMKILEQPRGGEARFHQLLHEYVHTARTRIRKKLGAQSIDLCIATGGNPESLGEIRAKLFDKDPHAIRLTELDEMISVLEKQTVEERIKKWDLRTDRADVILPAAIVLREILSQSSVEEVRVPGVGLKDGVLQDVIRKACAAPTEVSPDDAVESALALGQRLGFEEPHALTVTRHALALFDLTHALHELDKTERRLLEIAALLHDLGQVIQASGHHKHSQYLILHASLAGISDHQRNLIAQIARYHRKSLPSDKHELFKKLTGKDQKIVERLAALLRVADALDRQHLSAVESFKVSIREDHCLLTLQGKGDLLLEKWAVKKKGDLFVKVFHRKLILEGEE